MELFDEIFTTDGRLNRLAYIKCTIILILTAGIAAGILGFILGILTGDPDSFAADAISGLASFLAFAGGVMLDIRRLHDLDKSGWFALMAFIPLVNVIFMLYLFFAAGTVGRNRYGEDPLS